MVNTYQHWILSERKNPEEKRCLVTSLFRSGFCGFWPRWDLSLGCSSKSQVLRAALASASSRTHGGCRRLGVSCAELCLVVCCPGATQQHLGRCLGSAAGPTAGTALGIPVLVVRRGIARYWIRCLYRVCLRNSFIRIVLWIILDFCRHRQYTAVREDRSCLSP